MWQYRKKVANVMRYYVVNEAVVIAIYGKDRCPMRMLLLLIATFHQSISAVSFPGARLSFTVNFIEICSSSFLPSE
jgi:hypothetical protein